MEFEAGLRRRIAELEAEIWHFERAYSGLIRESGMTVNQILKHPPLKCCHHLARIQHFNLEQNVVDTAMKLVDAMLENGESIEVAKMHLIMAVSNLRGEEWGSSVLAEHLKPQVPQAPEEKPVSGT